MISIEETKWRADMKKARWQVDYSIKAGHSEDSKERANRYLTRLSAKGKANGWTES